MPKQSTELLVPRSSDRRRLYRFPVIAGEELVWTGTFATIVTQLEQTRDHRGTVYDEWTTPAAIDEDGRAIRLDRPDQLELFKQLDTGVEEFDYFTSAMDSIDQISSSMPVGELAQGFNIAAKTMLQKVMYKQRQILLDPETAPEQIDRYDYALRDLTFALVNISSALRFSGGWDDDLMNMNIWYDRGNRSRNSGYNALYRVCNDEFEADSIDHAAEVEAIGSGYWPDEFHCPGKLEVRVDPERRIEFIYTPELESAQNRHMSHTTVAQGGVEREYSNSALSIRIDLDPTAPHGVALDIGRSAYNGDKGGRSMRRDSDLLGSVFEEIDGQGSHEYAGFEEGADGAFKYFAERLAIQLDLQNKEIKMAKLARAALLRAA